MSERGNRKKLVGTVVSDKMDKTVVVNVDRRFQHPMYKKYLTRSHKYKAHDESNEFLVGDTVELEESRPVSKQKRWRVRRLIDRPVR
jgi:small subunit ribosomal protein S17